MIVIYCKNLSYDRWTGRIFRNSLNYYYSLYLDRTMDSKYGSGASAKAISSSSAVATVAPGWYTKGLTLGQIVFTCHYEMGVVGGNDDFKGFTGLSKSTGYEHLSYTFYKVLKITNEVLGVAELEKECLSYSGPGKSAEPSGSLWSAAKALNDMNYCYARPKNQIKKTFDFPWSTYGSLILTDPGIGSAYQPWDPFKLPLLEVHGIRTSNVKIIKIDMT